MIDTHAHLEFQALAGQTDAVIERARAVGVSHIISIACHLDECANTAALTKYPEVSVAFGLHPLDAVEATQADVAKLKPYLAGPRVVAVGECGLDFSRLEAAPDPESEIARQQDLTRAHIELANAHDLPVIFHVRDAHAKMRPLLEATMPVKHGVIHSFTGTLEDAQWYIAHGFAIGINGIITFKKSEALRDVVRQIPLTSIVLETDAPFLAPEPFRGKTNEPAYVAYSANVLSQMFEKSIEEISTVTSANAHTLFVL